MAATRRSLLQDLRRLGVRAGDLVMVHASLRRLGPVVGGAAVVVQALLDAVGPEGTLLAYVDFEPFFDLDELSGPGEPGQAGRDDTVADIPAFDPRIARAALDHGVLHEVMRTWPGARRSSHPDAGVVAIGPRAEWLVHEHPFRYGYGEGTPFARAVEANVRVLMLGAPLDTITLLHYAEHLARIPDKRVITYRRLMAGHEGPVWIDFEEFDTSEPVNARLPENVFEQIAEASGSGPMQCMPSISGPAMPVWMEGASEQNWLNSKRLATFISGLAVRVRCRLPASSAMAGAWSRVRTLRPPFF